MNTLLFCAKKAYKNQDYKTCITHCTQILIANKENSQAWKLCAFALWELGEKFKAIEYLEHSLYIFEDDISAWVALAEMHRKINHPQKSIEILSALEPCDCVDLYFNLARAYTDIGDFQEAIKNYKEVLKHSPNDVIAMHNLGNQFLNIKDFQNAKEMFEKASNLGHKDSTINLACVYCLIFEEKKALEIYRSLKNQKSKDAYFCFNYANALRYALDFKESKKMYKKAICMDAQAIFLVNYAYLLLSLGEYEEGFRCYQGRLMFENILPFIVDKKRVLPPFDKDITQKDILIYHEQGFGDTLMFSRFIDGAISLAKSVQILPQKELTTLFEQKWGDRVKKDNSQITPYEIALSIPSLPYVLGIRALPSPNIATTSTQTPATSSSPALAPTHPSVPSPIFTPQIFKNIKNIKKIGVFFNSISNSQDSKDRSIPAKKLFEAFEALMGFELYSLQPESTTRNICKKFGVVDLSAEIVDFRSTLEHLKKLDILITIDSAIAHLAGSYGIATIVLLPKRYDWRWGRLGQSNFQNGKFQGILSNWYPSIICIAQEKAGDWDRVLEILKDFLNKDKKDRNV